MTLYAENKLRLSQALTALWIVFLALVISGCASRLYFGVLVGDQAELVVLSQQYLPVYDEQIPVLTWLMTGLFRSTDYFILWPDIYKFACLGVCLFSVFRLTFHITKDASLSLAAALSMFFLPTFHEDMLGELTHTAALLAATALSTDWLVRQKPRGLADNKVLLILILYWLFGFLAKHTMSLVIIAQVAAYIMAFKPRKSVKFRLIISAALTFSAVLPVYIVIAGQSATLGQGLEEFYREEGFARGLIDLLTSLLSEAAVFIIIGVAAFIMSQIRKRRHTDDTQLKDNQQGIDWTRNAPSRFLALTLLFIILLFIPFIIIADIAVVRDRWLAPALMLLAPLLAIAISPLKPERIKHIRNLLLVSVCVLGIFRAGEPYIDRLSGTANIDNAPLVAMSKKLRRNNPKVGTYISSDRSLVATLKLQDPGLQIYTYKNINLFKSDKDLPRKFIVIELNPKPARNALRLEIACERRTAESIRNWTYFYEICKP